MKISDATVIVKCEFMYIQLAVSISHDFPLAHACTLGSMNVCVARSRSMMSRAFS